MGCEMFVQTDVRDHEIWLRLHRASGDLPYTEATEELQGILRELNIPEVSWSQDGEGIRCRVDGPMGFDQQGSIHVLLTRWAESVEPVVVEDLPDFDLLARNVHDGKVEDPTEVDLFFQFNQALKQPLRTDSYKLSMCYKTEEV